MIAETLRTWLLGVIAAGMIVGILTPCCPVGVAKAVAHTVGGMALLLVIVRPLLGLDLTRVVSQAGGIHRQQIQAQWNTRRSARGILPRFHSGYRPAVYIAARDDLASHVPPR